MSRPADDHFAEARSADALNRLLDARGLDRPLPLPDRGLADAVDRINRAAALDLSAEVISIEKMRIWEQLMRTQLGSPVNALHRPVVAQAPVTPNVQRPHSRPQGWAWWSRLQFAAMVLLVLGLLASLRDPGGDAPVDLFGGANPGTPPVDRVAVQTTPTTSPSRSASAAGPSATPEMPFAGTGPVSPSLAMLGVAQGIAPASVGLYRSSLGPGAELQIPASREDPISAITFIAAGTAVVTNQYSREESLTAGVPEHATSVGVRMDSLTIRAGAGGAELYQLILGGSGWTGSVPGTVATVLLASTPLTNLVGAAGTDNGHVDVTAGMVVQELQPGSVPGSTRTFGDDQTVAILTPLSGELEVRPAASGVRLVVGGSPAEGAVIAAPTIVSTGGSVVTEPGVTFDLVTPIVPATYLAIRVSVEATRDSDLATAAAQAPPVIPATVPATPTPANPFAPIDPMDGLDRTPIDVTLRFDREGLARDDPDSVAAARRTIEDAIGPFAAARCPIGVLLVQGNAGEGGAISDGQGLADRVVDLIQERYPEIAGDAFRYTSASLVDPDGLVMIQLLVYENCPLGSDGTPAATAASQGAAPA